MTCIPRATLRTTLLVLLSAAATVGAESGGEIGGIGGLLVAPTRLVLSARERSAEVTMVNRGVAPTTYRISLVAMRMTEDGRVEEVPEGQEAGPTASSLLTFSPRQVTLGPEETQRVRLLARRPANLPEGEYRSHLVFRAVPDLPAAQPAGEEAARVRVRLIGLPSVSIPVFVVQGNPSARATLSHARLEAGSESGQPRTLRGVLEREGAASLYGDVRVWQTPVPGERPKPIGVLRGVALYPPNLTRTVELALPGLPPDADAAQLRMTYERPAEDGATVLAECAVSAR